uniref:Complement factor H-related protein 5-like isoform X3 n=1 Tax=Pogona vitticeps TaxID=103695 RepID=A0ABM5G970_9SAUR
MVFPLALLLLWVCCTAADEIVCLPPHVENGDFRPKELQFRHEEQIEIVCHEGFQSSAHFSVCTEQGWQPPATCIPKNCDYVTIPNGYIYRNEPLHYFPKRLGYEMYYRCNSGFLPPNKDAWQKMVCTKSGWNPEPKCFKICDHKNPIRNGKFIYTYWTRSFIEGNTIPYSCDKGYHSENESATATCTKAGWSPPPRCFNLTEICTKPAEENVVFNTTKAISFFKETLRYECKEGFETIKKTIDGHTQCTENGWDPSPACLPIECEAPVLENGRVEEIKGKYVNGDVVRFSCLRGYTRVGPDSAQCYHFGWFPQPPICKEIQSLSCENIAPLNGFFMSQQDHFSLNEKVAYGCQSGFATLEGHKKGETQCLAEGWRPEPKCVRLCPPPPQLPNAVSITEMRNYRSGEEVVFKCVENFILQGPQQIMCEGGRWQTPPRCVEMSCQKPPTILNASYRNAVKSSYEPRETIDYECHPGFVAEGPQTITCRRGEWSQPSTCEDVRCPLPPAIPNGQINGIIKESYLPLEKLKYQCLPPYSLFGSSTVRCLNKEWTSIPECRAAAGRCDRPPAIENGDTLEMHKPNYMPGDKVHYKCQNMYRMDGNAEVICQNGHWTEPPTCIAPCSTSEEDMNMNNIQLKWKYDSKLYSESGDFVEFICRRGYHPGRASPPFRVQCVDGRLEYPRCVRQV